MPSSRELDPIRRRIWREAENLRRNRPDGPDIRTLSKEGGTVEEIKRLMGHIQIMNLPDDDLDLFQEREGYGLNYVSASEARRFLGVRADSDHPARRALADEDGATPHPAERPVPAPARPSAPPKGGRPPKAFWETLLIAMARRRDEEGWLPRSVTEVTEAMHDWMAAKGFEASESAVKERARKFYHEMGFER